MSVSAYFTLLTLILGLWWGRLYKGIDGGWMMVGGYANSISIQSATPMEYKCKFGKAVEDLNILIASHFAEFMFPLVYTLSVSAFISPK